MFAHPQLCTMTAHELLDHHHISELVTKLFVYTDRRDWNGLLNDVFTAHVHFDMSVFGDPASLRPATAITDAWKAGFADLDAVHHQNGNHLISLNGDTASIHADAIAMHYKASATKGRTRTFVGSYTMGAIRTTAGWRVDRFAYHLKFVDGNAELN
jgi:hypothetical protein